MTSESIVKKDVCMRAEHMTERERGSRELIITRAEVVLSIHAGT